MCRLRSDSVRLFTVAEIVKFYDFKKLELCTVRLERACLPECGNARK